MLIGHKMHKYSSKKKKVPASRAYFLHKNQLFFSMETQMISYIYIYIYIYIIML